MFDACHLKKVALNVKLFVLKVAKCKEKIKAFFGK
jgi:hypothetical protein